MTRPSPFRVVLTSGLGLGLAAAAGLVLATTAAADQPAAPAVPASVVAGTEFTVTGTGCHTVDPAHPAFAVVLTDAAEASDDLVVGEADAAGAWSVTVSFPADTLPGEHQVGAVCGSGDDGRSTESDYPLVSVTVIAPASPVVATASTRSGASRD